MSSATAVAAGATDLPSLKLCSQYPNMQIIWKLHHYFWCVVELVELLELLNCIQVLPQIAACLSFTHYRLILSMFKLAIVIAS